MKDFIRTILTSEFADEGNTDIDEIFSKSPLIRYLDQKTGAIMGNAKTRRSLANIYAIYSILYFYKDEFFNKPDEYRAFEGYEYTKLFYFYRGLYGGGRLQNHALNSRVNGEFKNKVVSESDNDLIVINNGKYALHIDYLYVDGVDVAKVATKIVEEYMSLLKLKDSNLIGDIEELIQLDSATKKKEKITKMLVDTAEARIFEIISYAILKNHYKNIRVFIGFSLDELREEYLTLFKTGRTNANDGGIDFVMRPLGRFFQVTEVASYDKYLLDIDKVLHFPITFVIKTERSNVEIQRELTTYIKQRSSGMRIVKERYDKSIEEIITINEMKTWLNELNDESVNDLLRDIDLYYRLELNFDLEQDEDE